MNFNLKTVLIILIVLPVFFYQCGSRQLVLNVNIVIDEKFVTKNINEAEVLSIVADQFEFAQSYFLSEFEIRFKKVNINLVKLTTENIQSNPEILRPKGTHIAVVYANKIDGYTENGIAYLESGNILMNVGLEDLSDARNTKSLNNTYKWLLIHELAHLFGGIDVKKENHVMDGSNFFGANGYFQPIENDQTFSLDEKTRNIVQIFWDHMKEKRVTFLFSHLHPDYAQKIIPLYEALLPESGNPEKVLYFIASYYVKQGSLINAISIFDVALQKQSNSELILHKDEENIHENAVLISKSQCLIDLNRINDAIDTLLQMNDDGPHIYEKYITLGKLYLNLGQYQKAINVYRNLTSTITPDNAQTWFVLGVSILETIPFEVWEGEEIEECKQALLKTIELAPAHLEAHAVLGTIYQLQEQPEQAEQHLKRVMELGLDHPLNIAKGGKTFAVMPP